MAILEGIQIQNFRALRDVTLGKTFEQGRHELPKLIAVIGKNGTGKSSLLDAFGFLGDCLRDGVEAACDRPDRGGFERLRTQGSSEAIKFEIRYRQTKESRPISYSLHIDLDRHGRPHVVYERLRQRRRGVGHGQPFSFLELTNGMGEVWAGESTQDQEGSAKAPVRMADRRVLGVATLGALNDNPRIFAFREFLAGWYLSYFVPQLARNQPLAGSDPHLDRTGENLARYIQFIERQNPTGFQQALKRISARIPGITHIKSDRAQDRRLYLQFSAEGFAQPFFQQDMSDGTLKMLAYLMLMEDPDNAPFIGIEEPENGLHHQLLAELAQQFQEFASKAGGPQILITTHSPHLVDALAPEEVWVLQKGTDGASQLTRAADIRGVNEFFKQGLPMGSLWFSNHLIADVS
jgi:predicted ATPase